MFSLIRKLDTDHLCMLVFGNDKRKLKILSPDRIE